ncbi:helix-turn-helix domain-containing protein, partial [Vibrio parahaemolyticus]
MDLLRINDACHVTGLSRKTIYRYMDKGTLKYQEINGKRYISLIDLEKIAHAKK